MEEIWRIKEQPPADALARLVTGTGASPLVATLLWQRGLTDAKAARAFLSPGEEQPFYDAMCMTDMEKAVVRIESAIREGERIVVYGDYDVDGITATSVLLRALRALGAKADYYIPTRQSGYGIHEDALRRLAADGAKLVVSVDCGISACKEAEAVADVLDLVITDHHLPGEEIPKAVAVVDPHREGEPYPYQDLCGVGVAFKLCQALWQRAKGEPYTADLDLVALGTVADMVPLTGENRKLVALGLASMQKTSNIGLCALIDVSGLQGKKINTGGVGFQLAPRLNASGRLDTASRGAELLLSEDPEEARSIAEELSAINLSRQEVEREILAQAEDAIADVDKEKARVLVAFGRDWHPGVVGLVASRLTEKYYRPSVVISLHDGIGKGSCRSIRGFHMFEALTACKEDLIQFGGHAMAAGLSVEEGKIDALREDLTRYADAHLTAEDYIPVHEAMAAVPPSALTVAQIEEIARLEPYGIGNPHPVFLCARNRASNCRLLGKEKNHLRFDVDGVATIGWRLAEQMDVVAHTEIEFLYTPEINEWNGNKMPQCHLQSLREAETCRVFPTRDHLANLYRILRMQVQPVTKTQGELAELCNLSIYTVEQGIRIFSELGLLSCTLEGIVVPPPPRQKLDLADSETFMQGSKEG